MGEVMPGGVSREALEALIVQMSDARDRWAAQDSGSMVQAPRDLLVGLADMMLVFGYEVLGWPQ